MLIMTLSPIPTTPSLSHAGGFDAFNKGPVHVGVVKGKCITYNDYVVAVSAFAFVAVVDVAVAAVAVATLHNSGRHELTIKFSAERA